MTTTTHECPYDGCSVGHGHACRLCGDRGYLCDRCKEDRADARAAKAKSAPLSGYTDAHVVTGNGHRVWRVRRWPEVPDCVGIAACDIEYPEAGYVEQIRNAVERAESPGEARRLALAILAVCDEIESNPETM